MLTNEHISIASFFFLFAYKDTVTGTSFKFDWGDETRPDVAMLMMSASLWLISGVFEG